MKSSMGAGQELLILLILKTKFAFFFFFFRMCFAFLMKKKFFFLTDPNKENRVICEAEYVQVRESVWVYVSMWVSSSDYVFFMLLRGGGWEFSTRFVYLCAN